MWPFSNKKIAVLQEEVKALSESNRQLANYLQNSINQRLQTVNDAIASYPSTDVQKQVEQYVTNDNLFSVVNKIAETTSLIPFYTYIKVPDKKAFRAYESLTNRGYYNTKAVVEILIRQRKALEDAPDNDALQMLLDTLDINALASFYLINGEAFIYKLRLNSAANTGKVNELHIWKPQNVVLNVSREYPLRIVSYNLVYQGQTVIRALPEDIIHIKNFNPKCTGTGDELRGFSPVAASNKVLTRLDSADNATVKQLQNGGVSTIIFDETITNDDVNQDTLDAARQHYYNFVTDPDNTGAAYFTAGKKGALATGLKLVDMDVPELQKMDFKRLCNVYKVSSRLFNDPDASTYNNLDTDNRQLYTNACLPLAYKFRDALNAGLAIEFKDKARYIDVDISTIPELQDEILKLAQAFAALPGGFSMNEIRSILKFDIDPDPNMDKKLVKQGYVFVDDLAMPPVDSNLINNEYALTG